MRKRRFGDRKDGRRVRSASVISRVMPYIMKRRSDAQNFFSDQFNIDKTEKFCREKVKEGKTNFSFLHVILAAYVRMVSQRPAVNRFISGQKVYSRDDEIVVNMAVKREMTLEAEDTMIKVVFHPGDTIDDVYEKFNKVVSETLNASSDSSFDKVAKLFSHIPGVVFRMMVSLLFALDYHGWLPKFLTNEVSPFHGSMIITSMGSLGIKPVYHHLYDFGNLPVFLAYGSKQTEYKLASDGSVVKHKYIDVNAVTDERIVDGFYYASAFKLLKRYVENPEELLTPPKEIFYDVD